MGRKQVTVLLAISVLYVCAQLPFWKDALFRDEPLFANDYHQIFNVYGYHGKLFREAGVSFWHPYNNCGQTNSCEAQNMFMYYPLNLIVYLAHNPGWGLKLFFFIHFIIGAVGMYMLGRHSADADSFSGRCAQCAAAPAVRCLPAGRS